MRARILPVAMLCSALLVTAGANGPKFFPDDPIWHDPETQDASGVQERPLSEGYDFVENSFFDAGEETDRPAMNVNTVDEVPDSSWFTNRAGRHRWTTDQFVKGPDTGGPAPPPWMVVDGKSRLDQALFGGR